MGAGNGNAVEIPATFQSLREFATRLFHEDLRARRVIERHAETKAIY
jgi:hypothetical protein